MFFYHTFNSAELYRTLKISCMDDLPTDGKICVLTMRLEIQRTFLVNTDFKLIVNAAK